MSNFDDSKYEILIGNLIHDIKYVGISNMGKLAGLRKHGEVMVRKILNIGNDTKLMLGEVRNNSNNKAIDKGMQNLGVKLSSRLIEIVNRINPLGREGTHTQHTEEFSDEEVKSVEDALLDLYALIFIRHFLKYKVSIYSSPKVLHEFSILPPIIRYKTWSYLYESDKNNIQVANKLCLSIIKTYSKEVAYKWLNENSKEIRAIPYPNDKERVKYLHMGGVEVAPGMYQVSLNFDKYNNMYDLLYDKIKDSRTSINESGKMYKTFEDAVMHYNNYTRLKITKSSQEEEEFHSLMKFVYLGRKPNDEL